MALSISALQLSPGEVNMYSVGFRNLIENHLDELRTDPSTDLIQISPHEEYRNEGDFYQLLTRQRVSQDMFWITMRVNRLHSPIDYKGTMVNLLLPSRAKVQQLLTRYQNTVTLR